MRTRIFGIEADNSTWFNIIICIFNLIMAIVSKSFSSALFGVVAICMIIYIDHIGFNLKQITKMYNSLETKYNDLFTQFQIHEQNRDEHKKD